MSNVKTRITQPKTWNVHMRPFGRKIFWKKERQNTKRINTMEESLRSVNHNEK